MVLWVEDGQIIVKTLGIKLTWGIFQYFITTDFTVHDQSMARLEHVQQSEILK